MWLEPLKFDLWSEFESPDAVSDFQGKIASSIHAIISENWENETQVALLETKLWNIKVFSSMEESSFSIDRTNIFWERERPTQNIRRMNYRFVFENDDIEILSLDGVTKFLTWTNAAGGPRDPYILSLLKSWIMYLRNNISRFDWHDASEFKWYLDGSRYSKFKQVLNLFSDFSNPFSLNYEGLDLLLKSDKVTIKDGNNTYNIPIKFWISDDESSFEIFLDGWRGLKDYRILYINTEDTDFVPSFPAKALKILGFIFSKYKKGDKNPSQEWLELFLRRVYSKKT